MDNDKFCEIRNNGKAHVTTVDFSISKTDGEYTMGDVFASKDGHDLDNCYIYSSDTRDVLIGIAKVRGCSISGSYVTTTHILNGEHVIVIDKIEVTEE